MATIHSAGSGDGSTLRADSREGERASLGELLRRARERRGLTLQQIAKETRLPQRHLEAIERDNLAHMPAGFYQRAEIRAYARAVGLDENVALSHLNPSSKPSETRSTSVETPGNPAPPRSRAYVLIALGAMVVAGVVFGRSIFERTSGVGRGTDHQGVTEPVEAPRPPIRDESPEPASFQREPPPPVEALPSLSNGALPASTEAAKPAAPLDAGVPRTQETSQLPPPVVSGTELVVTTQPEGARVTVDGFSWGVTPVTIHHLPPGDKRIRLTKEGYATEERVLRLPWGRQQALDVPLISAP
jgi:transcriptional regulator with XRE-family HTH domain